MAGKHEQAERENQRLWDELAPVHLKAYREVKLLEAGGSTLDELELASLGDVTGKRMLHLQCHIGTDTLSWVKQGVQVTGVDFSAASLDAARELERRLGMKARWIQANVYELPGKLDERFDVVYTSRGVICWLRDLNAWARIVADFLEPGGLFYLMESHPILSVLEEDEDGRLVFANRYFHRAEPTRWEDDGSDYADESYFPKNPSHEWDWSLGDIFSAVLEAGLVIEEFEEHERLFFKRYPSMGSLGERWYTLPGYEGKIPLMYTLMARKPGTGD